MNVYEDIQWEKVLPINAQSTQNIVKPAKGLERTLEENKASLDRAEV